MSNGENIKIGEAKGRPMLHWVGKQPLDYVKAFPAQKVEVVNPLNEENDAQGLLFHGDNKDVLAWLLANGYRGKVDLIYIDPPFDSGADYVRKVELRGVKIGSLSGEAHSLGEQVQYTDIWANDMYLQFMYERLLLLSELLSSEGNIFIHLDYRQDSYIRVITDEIFGKDNFRNEIIWCFTGPSRATKDFPDKHNLILRYSKSDKYFSTLDAVRIPYSESFLERREYTEGSGGIYGGDQIETSNNSENYQKGKIPEDWWSDIPSGGQMSSNEILGFPTQKPEKLLKRIIKCASKSDDLVLDCFVGSGTTAAVAQKLGRRWIAADINKGAVQTSSKRLQSIIKDQIKQGTLDPDKDEDRPSPAALSFSVYRVNDYDLQIQHNEAAKLAIEHVGIEELKSDTFFDGTRGDKLVKIIPFNHPLTLLDLQMVKDEIETRDDQRDILIVTLGKETQVALWLKAYNEHRPINRIEVIELRTDEKYGKFLVHQPAQAQVAIRREDGKIIVEIEDFISPTIVERLEMDTPLFKAQISDWRSMVDCVMIDLDYDGEVFNIMLSDVPEKKDDFVVGKYELPAPEAESTVAVKIIDMLGEEILISKIISSTP